LRLRLSSPLVLPVRHTQSRGRDFPIIAGGQGRLQTTHIANPGAGRSLRTIGPEFLITYDSGQTATSDAFEVKSVTQAADGLHAVLESSGLGLRAEIVYSSAPHKAWLYKQIMFTNIGTRSQVQLGNEKGGEVQLGNENSRGLLLRTVEVEHLKVTDECVTSAVDPAFPAVGDWGQPVFTESLWFGLEFPAARSSATPDGVVFLRHIRESS